jgi:glycosyltransferase involved in cell wall biosynthesis
VTFLGRVSDDELRWLYASAAALLAVSYEDLGLTPVEAALFGTPALALRFGGYLETVTHGVNGFFIDEATPDCIAAAVRRFRNHPIDPEPVRQSTSRYDRSRFEGRLHEIVGEQLGTPVAPSADEVLDLTDAALAITTDRDDPTATALAPTA